MDDALEVSLDNMACGLIMKALGNGVTRKGWARSEVGLQASNVKSRTRCLNNCRGQCVTISPAWVKHLGGVGLPVACLITEHAPDHQ